MKKFLKICLCLSLTILLFGSIPITANADPNTIDLNSLEKMYNPDKYSDYILSELTDDVIVTITDEIDSLKNNYPDLTEEQLDNYVMKRLEHISSNSIRLYSSLPSDSNKLNAAEKALFKQNPVKGANVCLLAKYALDRASALFVSSTLYLGNGDAFRHAYWNARMTNSYGAAYAKQWGDAHESTTPNGLDKSMDIFNNRRGREIAGTVAGGPYWEARMQSTLLNEISNGTLRRLVNNQLIKTDGTGRK